MALVTFVDKGTPPQLPSELKSYIHDLAKKKFGLTDADFLDTGSQPNIPLREGDGNAKNPFFYGVHVKSEKAQEIKKMNHPDFRWTAERPTGGLAPKRNAPFGPK